MADIKQIQIGSTKYNIDADKVDGKNASDFSQVVRFGTTGSTTKIKIKINSTATWMLCFTVTLYQGYRATKVMVSGYQYGSNYWYQPEARLLGDSDGTESISVYFGYDSVNNLWVGFDGGSYTGVSISDVTNGYTQLDNFTDLFTISNVSSLTTLQTTVTASSRANYASSAGNADTVDNKHASDFRPSTWTPTYSDVGAASAGHTHTYSDVGAASAGHTHSSYVNQNAYGKIKVGTTTTTADSTTDTIEYAAGGNMSVTISGDKITYSYTTPASLPANGGNADTVDNKHASDFRPSTWTPTYTDVGAASAGHTHSYIPLAGTTALAGNIVPTSNNTVDIGSYTKKIRYMYAASVRADRVCQAATDSIFYVGMRSDPGVTTVQVEADGNIILSAPSVYVGGSLIKNAAFYSSGTFASAGHTHTYGDVGAASAGHTHTYGDVGAASAGHTHTYADVGAASAGHNHDGTYLKTQYTSTFSVYAGTTCVSTFNQSANRSITFSAGNNITLTGTNGGGVITISATGGGGGAAYSYITEQWGYGLSVSAPSIYGYKTLYDTLYSGQYGAFRGQTYVIADNDSMYNAQYEYGKILFTNEFHPLVYEASNGWNTSYNTAMIGRTWFNTSFADALAIQIYDVSSPFSVMWLDNQKGSIILSAASDVHMSAAGGGVSIYGYYGVNINTGENQYGGINISAATNINIYGKSRFGGVYIFGSSYINLSTYNNYRGVSVNGIPVVAGYEHNVYAYRDGVAAFTVQVITSNSTVINTMAKLASQLYYAGYQSGAWCCNIRGLYGLGSTITAIVGCGTTYSDVCWQYVSTNSSPRPCFDQAWNTTNTGWVMNDYVRTVQK